MKRHAYGLMLFLVVLLTGFSYGVCSDFVFLASTIGPIDSGIVGALEDQFEKETGIRVRHVGAGTGVALDISKKGAIDLVMAHAKSLEEKFVSEGFGTERISLMYNDFVIVGPPDDPAGIKGNKSATDALKKISEKGATFVTRGDKSGPTWRRWNSGRRQASSLQVHGIMYTPRDLRGMFLRCAILINRRPIPSLIGPRFLLSRKKSNLLCLLRRTRPC